MMSEMTEELIDEAGIVKPKVVARYFHTSVREVAAITGLPQTTVGKVARYSTPRSQQRLRDLVMIINRVLPWCGNAMQAYAWYRSEPIPSFGDLTAEDLVKEGKSEAVLTYLGRIAEGGYA